MIRSICGTRGMAVAPHALAAQAALAVLREGGNALEAMVPAAATIAVVYPHMNSIGGDSFWLGHGPGEPPRGIGACGAAGGGGPPGGAPRRYLAPPPGFAATFLPCGQVPGRGSRFTQPRMADTLRQLARAGLDDFYRGELGRAIAADLAAVGSPVALADLHNHRAQLRAPLALKHSLGTLYNLPPPTQGLVSLLILGILDTLDIGKVDPGSAAYVHLPAGA